MTSNPKLRREDRVLRLSLNRPEKRNALRVEDCRHLVAALNEAELDPSVGSILIDAGGDTFCSGMDLTESLREDAPERAAIHDELFTFGGRTTKPVVAAVQGNALAGGLGLVANAHVVVAADNAGFGLVEIRIALWPFVVFRSVATAIGERRALELSLTGRVVGAEEALQWGLAHHVVPASEIGERASAIACMLSRFSPDAMRRGLDYVHRSRALSQKEAVALADSMRRRTFRSADFKEGVNAFFEKREAKWPSLGD
ncbi:MAG: enoyl-CoA hydratase/isomerase family protein [bacterium]|nr:enoyl-CoA hydratase/isomerase family protein [bacterium]